MITPHNVVIKESLNSYPMYRWEALCSCAWNAKVPTETEAKEVSQRHINANGASGAFKVTPSSVSFDPSKGTQAKPGTPLTIAPEHQQGAQASKNKFAPSVNAQAKSPAEKREEYRVTDKPLTPQSSSNSIGQSTGDSGSLPPKKFS